MAIRPLDALIRRSHFPCWIDPGALTGAEGRTAGRTRRSRAELRPLVLKRTGWDPLSNQAWEMLRDRYGYVGEQVSLELVVS